MDTNALNTELTTKEPRDIIKAIYAQFEQVAISFSGAEDVVLIDLACKQGIKPHVFTLDTGRLHAQTYGFIEQVRNHYDIPIHALSPDAEQLQQLTAQKGLFSFYQDGHAECCAIRKVAPLRKHLQQFDAWVTGQRRDQSKATRDGLNVVETDNSFSGRGAQLTKFNPLCHWTSEQVWNYIRALEVPYNPLHEQGYISIGCEPCTRATLPHQDPREGRWWWEAEDNKECGLHVKDQ